MAKEEKKKKASSESSSFSFSSTSKDFEVAANSVFNAVAMKAASTSFHIMARKKKLYVIAQGIGCFCAAVVPNAKSEGEGVFGIEKDYLLGTIKNRSVIDFTFTGTECPFKQAKGPYKGTLITVPITEEQDSLIRNYFKESVEGATLDADVIKAIRVGIEKTSLQNIYGQVMETVIKLGKKELVITTRCSNHFAMYSTEVKSKSTFVSAIPSEYFPVIDKLSGGNATTISFNKNEVAAKGENFMLFLPSIQVDEDKFNMVQTYLEAQKKPEFSCEVDVGKLSITVDNLSTLYKEGGADFEFTGDSDKIKIGLTTSNGSASDQLKVKGKGSVTANVDPRLLKDLLSCSKGVKEVKLSVNDRIFLLKAELKDDGKVVLACSRSAASSKTSEKKKK